jgi:hypothetical protein
MRLWTVVLICGIPLLAGERQPMEMQFQDSASYRWLNHRVLESRLLDDMESLANWSVSTRASSAAVLDARVASQATPSEELSIARMALTQERSRDGSHSLRVWLPTRLDRPGPASGRGWGSASVTRRFDGEDWSKFNRISLWVYTDCPGTYLINLSIGLRNGDGTGRRAEVAGHGGGSVVMDDDDPFLKNHEWNHVYLDLRDMPRNNVTGVSISHAIGGNEPEEEDTLIFDLDHLELERVDVDEEYVEGWGVWPGRISYSHTGYQSGAMKTAIATGLSAKEFRLVDQANGVTVLTKPVQTVKTNLGTFQVMDFSEVRQAGSYALEAGEKATHPFRIDPNVWRQTIFKVLNAFYVQRCGFAIPGVHGVCHRDWQVIHDGKRIVINGGWHDAGDLTQGMTKTGEITYGMFSLAERLQASGEDAELYERVLEEAKWGLDWVLRTSFGDGYRNSGSVSSRKTNGIIGDFDDITVQARNVPQNNFLASAAEAIAYRVLRERDPRLAAYCLRMAEADWRFAVAGIADPATPWTGAKNLQELFRIPFDSENVPHEAAATGVLASVDLWRATGDQRYADKAAELARIILDSQQRKRPNWNIPFTGFFYASPAKDRVVHYVHQGHEQGPVLAMSALCQAFPNHPDWMKWYSSVVLHSEYLKGMAKYTEPYEVLPASIYRDDEYKIVPETVRDTFQKQVLNGVPLGAGNYLRLFPVWLSYRGDFGTVLPQTQALAGAAHLRGDLEAAQLSQQQLEWVIGRNPFAQSMMWGEGYDFTPLQTGSSGDMVGGIPVGIQTRGDADVPYWPIRGGSATYKEIWVHPMGRWIWLMRDLAGPAVVEGQAGSAIEFKEATFGQLIEVKPNLVTGRFRIALPEGKYIVRSGGAEQTQIFLPGGTYNLDLRPGRAWGFEVSKDTSGSGEVTIKLTARGSGSHRFVLRVDNLTLSGADREVTLRPGVAGTLEWRARIASPDTPWVAVVVPDDDLAQRKELTGAAWEQ